MAVAQAVSRRLPAAAALVRAWAKSCGICGGQSGTGATTAIWRAGRAYDSVQRKAMFSEDKTNKLRGP
jgi:hypothetical protein